MEKFKKQLRHAFTYATASDLMDPNTYSKVLAMTCVVLDLVFIVLTVCNMVNGYNAILWPAFINIFVFTLMGITVFFTKKNNLCAIITIISLTFVVIYFTFFGKGFGQNKGFSYIWILLIPLISSFVVDFKIAFFTSFFYQILIVLICYVPSSNAVLCNFFSEIFVKRFPFIYFVMMNIAFTFGISYRSLLYKQKHYQEELERAVDDEHDRVLTMSLETILSINDLVNARDPYTALHSERVSEYSCLIAKKMGWDEEKVKKLRTMALLHDVGKVGVPDSILNKSGPLDDEEYEVLKSHTTIGGRILKNLSCIPGIETGALYHHEHYDGTGYPSGLIGAQIPVEARIIAVADSFDAMHSDRIYRKRLELPEIRQEFVNKSGIQFDPGVVDCFLELLDEGKIN